MTFHDWAAWYAAYDDPDSSLAQRLGVVRTRIRDAVAAADPGPIRVVSMCAGDRRGVGVHRYGQAPRPLTRGERLFRFTR